MRPYVPDPVLPTAVIVDIDGTLAHMTGRSPYDFAKVGTDRLSENVARVANYLSEDYVTILMSGRPDSCRDDTTEWLYRHGIMWDHLFMRRTHDNRPDEIVKYELFDRHVRGNWNVLVVLDDRDKVVRMWRGIGLTCLQVAPGAF